MGEPASLEPEVAFLRSQVVTLQSRLCDTLAQQVAQQQTVLIAAMQTNLALTQTVDKLHAVADGLVEALQRNQNDPPPAPGTDFGTILATLAPYLLGAAQSKPGSGQTLAPKDQPPKDPPPLFTLPKEVTDLMRNRPVPQAGPQPSTQTLFGPTVTTVLRQRADGSGFEETTRTETKKIYPDPTRVNPVPGAPAPKAQVKKPSKETKE